MVWLLALVWTVTWAFSFTEGAEKILVRGEIDGNVTVHCPLKKQMDVQFFYFQRGDEFVNGFHRLRSMENKVKPWNNTIVVGNETAVHIYGLNISHSGDYKCYIKFMDGDFSENVIHLQVTANYSKPTFTSSCPDDFSCTVTCASHGGYPSTRIMWDVPESGNTSRQMWKVVNNSEERIPGTVMFSSSSTANFNCSKGEMKFLSCFVGDIHSDRFSVCPSQNPPVPTNPPVIVAAAVCAMLALPIVIMVLRWYCRRKTRETGASKLNLNGYGQEVTVFSRLEASEAP